MKPLNNLLEQVKSTLNLTGYIDTEAAEKAIRGNIYFKGPNAWILAIATIMDHRENPVFVIEQS